MFGLRGCLSTWVACALLVAPLVGCGGSTPPATTASTSDAPVTVASMKTASDSGARIVSLAIGRDSLTVDKVGGRDGALFPDGIRDLSFEVEVFGPITTLYLMTVDEQGEPDGRYRVNTLVGESEAPKALGGTLEKGRFSAGLGAFENGKLVNRADGSLEPLDAGRHLLKLYTSNPGSLQPGLKMRAFAELPDRSIIKGPVMTIP